MLRHLLRASSAALFAGILIAPIFGIQIFRLGSQTFVKTNWLIVLLGMLIVFIFQLLRPALSSVLFINFKPLAKMQLLCSDATARLKSGWLMHSIYNNIILIFIIVAVIWPFFASQSHIDLATLVLIYIVLALGLNIVVGFAGLLNLGFGGFYAVGAYTYGLLYYWAGWGFWQALPVSGIMAAVVGFILGLPVLRLRGDYLAIVTLGFGEIIRLLLNNLGSITGGPDGISSIPKPTVFGYPMLRRAPEGVTTFHDLMGWSFSNNHIVIYLYLLALCLALFTLFVSNRLVNMPIGRAWEALREDEIACKSLGLNPGKIKLSAFIVGAMFAGFGGAFFAARQGIVAPDSFTFLESALILAIVVLGGMGSTLGVIIAAILITVIPEVARGLSEYRMLTFGLTMVLMMMWRPQGLFPAKRKHVELPV